MACGKGGTVARKLRVVVSWMSRLSLDEVHELLSLNATFYVLRWSRKSDVAIVKCTTLITVKCVSTLEPEVNIPRRAMLA